MLTRGGRPVNLWCGWRAAWHSLQQLANTRRFTLGVPHAVTVSRDGGRVLFLRTRGGDDPVTCLWGWTWPTVRENASGSSPIRRRRGTPVLAAYRRPSASGGSAHARLLPGSSPTRPTRTAGPSCSRWTGGCWCCAPATTRAPADDQEPVPLENRIRAVTCGSFGISGGARAFVDQAAQNGFPEDPSAVEVGIGGG